MLETEKIPVDNSNKVLALQDYLSIGYLFLLVVGVVHESIYYNFLGVNILEYSSILDVLISPIAVIFGNPLLGVAVVLAVGFAYGYLKLIPRYYKWIRTKKKYQEGKYKLRLDKSEAQIRSKHGALGFIAFYVFSVFVGLGIGRGTKTNQKIQSDDIKRTHLVFYRDGTQEEIKMLGKNSLYLFYVTKGQEEVSIAPIDGNIKLIKNLKKD